MRLRKYNKSLGWLSLFAGTVLFGGCNSALLDPKGQTGLEQRSLILVAFGLMLIIIIPTILMAVGFAWKYHASNKDAKYSPSQSHSNKVETVVWTVPILIIIFPAVLTWKTTHVLEPSRPLTHGERLITIEMVSMDWRWFFIYPGQGIATVNEIAFPVNTPAHFKMTSSSAMNSFFIPCLGSQIYTMAGMQTRLHLITNEPGTYNDISTSYSGPSFSGMKFKTIATPDRTAFDQWVAKARQSPNTMSDVATFEKLAAFSEYNQVEYFSNMEPDLFADVINRFMARGKSMGMTQPEGEHSAHEGMEGVEGMKGVDMSHAESVRQRS